ncbi:MAG TPA: hypothetical protein VN426_12780 [Syntrophomonadaceae bacterium]|nr:hypothetical protein [Syntrophomonadaceae bacterium]
MRNPLKRGWIMILMVSLLLAVMGCSTTKDETQTGTLNSMEAFTGIDDALQGNLAKADFAGIVVLIKDNGDEVKAYCPNELSEKLRAGQTLEVKKIQGTDQWIVTRIVKEP